MFTNVELFMRWYAWSIRYKDCDPAVWCTQYLNARFEHNIEEKYWFAWLYANTYNLPSAWVIKQEFPDYELVDLDRLTDWNTKNSAKLMYQTDTKWNKGHLPSMFESYKKFIGSSAFTNKPRIQCERFGTLAYGLSPEAAFDVCWDAVNNNLFKFGRYTTWFYLQHLKHTCGLQIEPSNLKLNDFNGSRSHREGLLHALNLEAWCGKKLSETQYDLLEKKAKEILEECRMRWPQHKTQFDFFTMETCLCSFKKLFRPHHGRYLGYYLDRQSEEIMRAEQAGWYGVCWRVLWQAREECLDSRLTKVTRTTVDKKSLDLFYKKKQLPRIEWMFDDMKPAKIKEGIELWMNNEE